MKHNRSCPCCGYTEESLRPSVSLDANAISYRGRSKRLQPREAELAASLVETFGQVVHHERLQARVYGIHRHRMADSNSAMKAHICMLRKKIEPLGLKIEARWGVGLAMTSR